MQVQQMGLPSFKKDTKQIHLRNRFKTHVKKCSGDFIQKSFTYPQVIPNLYDLCSIV